MNAKLYLHPSFSDEPATLDGQVLIRHATLPDTETLQARIQRQRDAMICAIDLLRIGDMPKAIEVLEDNLQ